jgi:hypothetical protein
MVNLFSLYHSQYLLCRKFFTKTAFKLKLDSVCGAVLLVAMRWAATAILVTVFLVAPLAQFGAVEANPGIPGIFDAPTIDIDSPHMYPGDLYQETSIPIEVRVSPFQTGVEFVDMYYSLDDGPNITLSMFTIEDYTAIFGEGTLDNLTDGNHTVKAFSTDTQGNTISWSTTFLVNTTIRFSPFLLSPTNTTYNIKEIPFTYSLDESKYAVYNSIDNYSPYMIKGNTTLAELSEGQHTITAIAYDNGVIYSKQKAFFTIDTSYTPTSSPEPTSTPNNEPQSSDQQVILGVAIIVAVLAVGLGLLVYLAKRK